MAKQTNVYTASMLDRSKASHYVLPCMAHQAWLLTHLVAFVCDSGVVFDLPESLSKTLPLVCLSKLLLTFIIREQILGTQECPTVVQVQAAVIIQGPLWIGLIFRHQLMKILTSHVSQKRTPGICLRATSLLLQVTHQSVNQKHSLL